jgi:uncharacterized membrane protein (UPF0127 family)
LFSIPVRSAKVASLLLGLLAAAACSGSDDSAVASIPETPAVSIESSTPSTQPSDPLVQGEEPQGFSTVTARITKPDGEVCEVCLWLADSADERGRGLMGVTDLGEPTGMAFLFEEAVNGNFFMFQTPTPLSIAWFAEDGSMVGVADMAPCLDANSVDCPRYSPDAAYQLVVEVFEGDLPGLGLEPGASVELLLGTESETCVLAG